MNWSSVISFKSNHKIKLLALLPRSYLRCSRHMPIKLLVLSPISIPWAVSSVLLATILLKTCFGNYCKSRKKQRTISLVKHEQSQEQNNCDIFKYFDLLYFLVTDVVNYSVERTVTWWAMCWPFRSELQNEWDTRREWMNLFIIDIKFKTLQFVFNFLASSVLFHKK